jgi:hypothetical protein
MRQHPHASAAREHPDEVLSKQHVSIRTFVPVKQAN